MVLRKINDNELVINLDETTRIKDVNKILSYTENLFNLHFKNTSNNFEIDKNLLRTSNFYGTGFIQKYNSETELLRYIHKLAEKDYTLCDGMIPLGSCTMKLTSCSEMEALSYEDMTDIHPYVPSKFNKGYLEMIEKIGDYLKEITGFQAVSFQSNSGSMGEYLGLLVIKKYFTHHGLNNKNLVLIPNSAHGTNFASANLANMRLLKYDDDICLDEFAELVYKNKDELACLMVTYPNTNGVFQKNIKDICDIIHNAGGLVYMDGANMNAQVGITNPALSGADVCHLNLHKTFCIPHGGGGPGMGPILCNDKLKEFLPVNNLQVDNTNLENDNRVGNITSSQWSSASILSIPYMYISMMGEDGLRKATQTAILNANYLKAALNDYYTIKDVNENGLVGHEFIIDTMEFRKIGISESDIAKRLIDYSFHPPTMSWPRGGVLMFEPTESECKEELDRLIEALISIREEIREIEKGEDKMGNIVCKNNNVLKNAPHNFQLVSEEWKYPYSFKKAFYPVDNLKEYKFNVPIGRINDIEGDKNLLQKK